MESICKENSSSWEEKIYWGHFSAHRFAQFLLTDFEDHLDLPDKFTTNLKHRLPGTVTLRGPTGITWNVELVTSDDTMSFKNGWKQFVNDNSLVENDFLIFKYNGESQFDVLMFDALSICEKEATYFVREPGHSKPVSEFKTEGRKETSDEVIPNSSPDGVECPILEQPNGDDGVTTTPEQNIFNQSTKKTVRRKVQHKSSRTMRGLITRRMVSAAAVLSEHDDLDADQSYAKRRKANANQYESNRRPVTEEEKKKALEAAEAAANNESVIVIMRPTSVYKKFYAVIPSDWLSKHVKLENQDVIVRCGNKKWHTRLNYVKSRNSAGLSGGWKNFVVDNNLEEDDVCVFQLASGSNTPIILDVSIFRVVQETTPLIGVF